MEIAMPDRRFRDIYVINRLNQLDATIMTALNTGNYGAVESITQQQLELINDVQNKENRSIHKGSVFYYKGLALFYQNMNEDAIHNIILAYIEDTLNVEYDLEEDADNFPAANKLREIYFKSRILREIKIISSEMKCSGKWNDIRDPDIILSDVAKRLDFDPNKLIDQRNVPIPKTMPVALTPTAQTTTDIEFKKEAEIREIMETNIDPLLKQLIEAKTQRYSLLIQLIAVSGSIIAGFRLLQQSVNFWSKIGLFMLVIVISIGFYWTYKDRKSQYTSSAKTLATQLDYNACAMFIKMDNQTNKDITTRCHSFMTETMKEIGFFDENNNPKIGGMSEKVEDELSKDRSDIYFAILISLFIVSIIILIIATPVPSSIPTGNMSV